MVSTEEILVHTETVIGYAKRLGSVVGYLKGDGPKPDNLRTKELQETIDFVEPIAKDSGGQVNVVAKEGSNVTVNLTINSLEANAIQNKAYKEIEYLNEPNKELFKNVLLYWAKASNEARECSTDRVVVEEISERPLRVFFNEDDISIKTRMVGGIANPLTTVFRVDVELMVLRGSPYGVTIIRLHDVVED